MKNIILFLSFFPCVVMAQEGFSLTEKVKSVIHGSVPTVSTDEVKAWKNAKILDAREIAEFEVSHLPNATHVGDKQFKLSSVSEIDKKDTVIVYCTVGYRSEGIGEKLAKAGYENVYNLFGGIFAWKNNGGTVVNTENKPTQKVHCYNKAWSIFLTDGEKVY